jgi:hypothetical protein
MASDQGKRRRGGIRERGGVYQVRVYVGADPVTGDRVDLTGTAVTERDAEKLLTQFLAEKDARRAARSRITFGDAATGSWPTSTSRRRPGTSTRAMSVGRRVRLLAHCRSPVSIRWPSRACTRSFVAVDDSAESANR